MPVIYRSYRVRIDLLSDVVVAKVYESTHLALDGGRACESALQELRRMPLLDAISPEMTVLVTCEPLDPIEANVPEVRP